ncbi:MAG: hypothetical protein ACXAC7_23375 [Candidatus Hodarchaeales archaeon]
MLKIRIDELILSVFMIFVHLLLNLGFQVIRSKGFYNIGKTNVINVTEIPISIHHHDTVPITLNSNDIFAQSFDASHFLDQLDSFNQSGINAYVGDNPISDFPKNLSYLTINITNSTIINDGNNNFIVGHLGGTTLKMTVI